MITHIQITTSHNPAEDNGIKIIGPDGLSMKTQFEPYIEEFSDTESLEKSCEKLKKSFVTLNDGKEVDWSEPGYVLVGCDTRTSSLTLLNILM
jgi:phosphomannomutase